MKAIALAVILLIALPACAELPASAPTRRMVVVIWERRAPEDRALRFGSVLQSNREVLLDLLYGAERPLIGNRRSNTVLAIYPEGLPAESSDSTLYAMIRLATPEQLVDRWLPRMVATPDSPTRVRGLRYAEAPSREVLKKDIRRNITLPLLGIDATDLEESAFDRRPDQNATRGVSFPSLVTPWAIYDAAVHAGYGPPLAEVYVVWVLSGDKDYDQSLPDERIPIDLGRAASELYTNAQNVFAISGDESRRSTRAARGRVRVFQVSNMRTRTDPPGLRLVDGSRPAFLDFTARWKTPRLAGVPLVGDALRRLGFFRSLGDLPATRWKAVIPQDKYRLLPGGYRWQDGSGATAMTRSGEMTDDLRTVVLRRLQIRNALREDIAADALALPEPELGPPYLRSLWVPIASEVHASGRVIVTVRGVEWWVYLIAAIGAGAILFGVAIYFMRREVHIGVRWPESVNFPLGRAEDGIVIRPQLMLQDRSGLPRRRADIAVTLSIARAVAGLPLVDDSPLCSVSPTQVRLRRLARRSATEGIPIEIRVSGKAIDMARVIAGSRHHAAVQLRVAAEDWSNHYHSAAIEAPYVFDVTIGAADPDATYLLAAGAVSPIKERGLFYVPGETSKRVRVGWVRVENRAEPGLVARDVVIRLDEATIRMAIGGSAAAIDAQPQIVAFGDIDPRAIALKNGERANFDVYLIVAPGGVPNSDARCEISVRGAYRLAHKSDKWRPLPARTIPFRWFPFIPTRHACLDLGTSSVRLLREGGTHDPDRWGYALFDQPPLNEPPLNERWPSEDLPSFVFFDVNGRALLGQDALRGDETSDRFHMSVKNFMIDNHPGGEGKIRAFIDEFFRKYYVPLTRVPTLVLNPYSEVEEQIVAGDAEVLVATIPNDCSARYRDAFEKALVATKRFRQVSLLHEAEAVSIWYSSWRREQRLDGRRKGSSVVVGRSESEAIIVDVGAGTTDTAWAKIIDEGGLQAPSVRIRSIGAASLAGRFVDDVIVEELIAHGWITREALARLGKRKRLEIGEGVKIAIAKGETDYVRPAVDLTARRLDLNAEQLMTIADSHAYRNAIAEIAEASLSVLLGRLPADVKLRESRTILLTGRGARMHGLKDAIVNYLKSHGVDNVTVADVPERLLKASVTIGCRAFAANYWSELKKASDATIDRMLLVYRDTKGVSHCDMLPSETPVDHGGPWVEIPQWTDAKLIATHLRTDAVFDDPRVRLDEKKIGEILDGRLQAPRRQWHPPYSLVLGAKDLPRSDDGRRVKARLLFRREGVAIEEQTV